MAEIDDYSAMGGVGPLTPEEKKEYELEYKHGADLFIRAIGEYSKSDNIYQREEFKGVMEKAMQVLNETARELQREELIHQNREIAKDFAAFQTLETPDSINKLSQDLNKAKKSISNR